jgi:hypothetical protein
MNMYGTNRWNHFHIEHKNTKNYCNATVHKKQAESSSMAGLPQVLREEFRAKAPSLLEVYVCGDFNLDPEREATLYGTSWDV